MLTTSKPPKPYSILITDDDLGCRETLREVFEPEGFRTVLAASGEEAIDIIREEPVHLAVLDMHLPRLTGLETIELARQVNAVMPFILVTGNLTDELMRQALRARAYSVLAKPINKNQILYTVVRALVRAYGGPQGTSERNSPEGSHSQGAASA